MGDPVTSAGSGPPANQTTNASQSGAASPADPKFDEALKQESLPLCPEGLRRPHKDDAPCTYLRPPSLSSSSQSSQSQSSKPDLQLHKDIPNPHKNDPNGPGYDNYKNRTPPERDPNPTHGLNPPSVPGDPSYNDGPNHDGHFIMFPLGPQAPKPSPEQEQNQTPYQPPSMRNSP
jgi:hypothetical protein